MTIAAFEDAYPALSDVLTLIARHNGDMAAAVADIPSPVARQQARAQINQCLAIGDGRACIEQLTEHHMASDDATWCFLQKVRLCLST